MIFQQKKRLFRTALSIVGFFIIGLTTFTLAAESGTQVNLELYNTVYRGKNAGFYGASGLADVRFFSTGKNPVKAEVAVNFFSQDLAASGGISEPRIALKRLWIKVNFPSWRLTSGKTRLAWGNGFVFNAGDLLFGSLSPYLDFTQSTLRNETAFLTAINIPLGQLSYLEAVILPPNLNSAFQFGPLGNTSGGMRLFFRFKGFRLETGYLYKGEAKVPNDLLGHRPYISFHAHAGIDFYGAFSLAAGPDNASGDRSRDTWAEIAPTISMSFGAFHQIAAGYDGTLSFRLETLIMPWQNWHPIAYQDILNNKTSSYGIMLYPEIRWTFASAWSLAIQSVISAIDGSAQLSGAVSWNAMQGLTFLGIVSVNLGETSDLFAWDRIRDLPQYPPGHSSAGEPWADSVFNGVGLTLGARYTY